MKSITEVIPEGNFMRIGPNDRVLMLGSCFAAEIGARLSSGGYDVLLNPFGTIFNPFSVASSIERLRSGRTFSKGDCVHLGAGSGLWGSYSHYTKHARASVEDFLRDANEALSKDSAFFARADKVIITFGTAWCFHLSKEGVSALGEGSSYEEGYIVSNCLKRHAKEFERKMAGVEQIVSLFRGLLAEGGALAGKQVLFTVSPIRHMADTAHGNQLSKATLLLAVDALVREFPDRVSYFPAYEIVLDQLRDYKWFAQDLVHPSREAVDVVWDKFKACCLE
ncbi:MAG: GSCFA domain-containing protein [Bacteroidales bacterium]|nr:GSCFA domain-containing protein [Bacteroidales bacterium]